MSLTSLNYSAAGTSPVGVDYAGAVNYQVVKIGYGAESVAPTLVSTAAPMPISASQSGTWNVGTVTTVTTVGAVTAITNALPAGTNAIGKLAANSGVDIGDVDVTSIAAGDNNIGNVDIVTVPTDPFGANADAASATGSISAKLRFIASTGIPVTGTVTTSAAQSGTWNVATVTTVSTVTAVTTVSTVSTLTGGGVAHDGADSGNPIKVGGRARTSDDTAVANNDRADFITDKIGRQVVAPFTLPENLVDGAATTAGTSNTAVIAAQGAGVSIYVTELTIANTGATDILVTIKDGSTAKKYVPAAASCGGAIISLPVPLKLTANTALNFSASATTSGLIAVSATGYKGA